MNLLNDVSQIPRNNPQLKILSAEPKKKSEYKPDILDIFCEKVVNKRDIKDTVTMPRAIFKGYLCFTAGTAINAIAGMLKNVKVKNVMGIIGSVIAIYGTFNFVKPFLIREKNLTNNEK